MLNRKAYFNYLVLEEFVAGIQLVSSEVKSLVSNKMSFSDSYCNVINSEVFWRNGHIDIYEAARDNHEPKRPRKLLLTKKQISEIEVQLQNKGLTLIPLSLEYKKGKFKLKIAICKGKKLHDKRNTLKARDSERIEKE